MIMTDKAVAYDKAELDSRLFDGFADTSRRRYVFLCNMSTNISRWSRNAVDYFGLPGEYMEDAGMIWANFIHPEDREMYLNDLEQVFSGVKSRHDLDYRVRNRDGEYVICTCRGHVIKGENGQPDLFMGSIENHGIMDNVDSITNLYNIYEFWQNIRVKRESGERCIVMLFSINKFSEINDSYGYAFGNKLLRAFAVKMREILKGKGILYRMDGIRFACCFNPEIEKEEVERIYAALQHQAKHHICVDGDKVAVTISGGAVPYNENYDEYSIQTSARYALEQSKHRQYGELVFFDFDFLNDNKKNLVFMKAIRESILSQFEGFYLCYQPIVGAQTENLIGAEALLRWNMEPFGEVPPGVFLPWLENDSCFWELGNWILKKALLETKPVLEKYPDFVLNVNLAFPQLSHGGFVEMVKSILEETGFPTRNLCMELTERCRQMEMSSLQAVVNCLKALGIKIALDDFGTGFSSLNLLSELPIDTLKIDRGFIFDIQTNFNNQAIVKAVTGCAEDLHVNVCLEGLEDRKMIDFVKQYPVYSYQGYHFSRPIPMPAFREKYGIE